MAAPAATPAGDRNRTRAAPAAAIPGYPARRSCAAAGQQQAARRCGNPSGPVVLGAVIAAPTSPAAVNGYTVPDIRKLTQPPFTACVVIFTIFLPRTPGAGSPSS